ncbi:MAG: hypothetical protein QOF76_4486 [Solirubrobacteraceae bacterium]|jgi:hypothetical protein|nr:hypothetical protein [Solirubrobacteraceae bacterium]
MSQRLVVGILAFVLWASMISLTIYDMLANGPSILSLISLTFVGVLGMGVFGSLGGRSGKR